MKKRAVASLVVVLASVGNGLGAENHTHPHPGPVDLESRIIPQNILNQLEVGFLMEVEGFAAKSGDASESDLTLATVELTLDAEIVDGITGHLGLLWEEDDTEENNLDEGYITFGATEDIPFYATAGKMYLPFGNFESAFISDPLTLEMAEINESAGLIGYGNDWMDAKAGGFNGNGDDTVKNAFASIAFTPVENLAFGAYWLSNLLETDGFETTAFKSVGGAGAFINAQLGPVAFNAEFVTALGKIGERLPATYNLEASMPITEALSAGIKFEGSDDFSANVDGDKFADWQTGFVVSYAFNEHITLSGEFLHADGLDNNESRDRATFQIAMEL